MAQVVGRDPKTEMQRGSTNNQIGEIDHNPSARLLAVNPAGQTGYLERQRMHWNGFKKFFDEGFATFSVRLCSGPVNTVC